MKTFEEYWIEDEKISSVTHVPGILIEALKEVAKRAWEAGRVKSAVDDVVSDLSDKLGHHKNWKYCPGCGNMWEKDSEEFGCWSCGFVNRRQ